MLCKYCGNEVPAGDKFCNSCGSPQPTAYSQPVAPVYNAPPAEGGFVKTTEMDVMAWVMAAIPIVGTVIGILIGFGYACLVLNVILCYVDYTILEKNKVPVAQLDKNFCFIVPVYLYKRAKVLGDNLAYFIVWCVAFVLSIFCNPV